MELVHQLTQWAFRVTLVVAGCLLVYIALFLREDEEGRIQNRLEEWWIRLDDASRRALSKEAVFLRFVVSLTNRTLDAVFGGRLLSARAFAVSACLSGASFSLVFWLAFDDTESASGALLLIVLAILPLIWPRLIVLTTAAAIILLVTPYGAFAAENGNTFFTLLFIPLWLVAKQLIPFAFAGYAALTMLVMLLPVSILSDMAVIAIERRILAAASASASTARIALLVGINVAIVAVIVAMPLAAAEALGQSEIAGWAAYLLLPLYGLALTNIITSLVPVMLMLIAIGVLMHRLFWPLLQRPVYAIARRRVVTQPRLVGGIGLALIGAGSPRLANVLLTFWR